MISALLAVALGLAPPAAAAQPAVTPAPSAPSPQPTQTERRPFTPAPRPLTPPTSYAPPPTSYATPPATLPPRPAAPPTSLSNASEAQVRARLGQPQIARREAGGAMWTYTSEACALLVFFQAQGREGLRVTGASAGPRQRGRPAPDVETCITSNVG